MRWMVAIVLGVFGVTGCTSALKTARKYEEMGKHELALLYYAENFNEDTEDEDAKELLVRSFDLSIRNIDAEYDKAISASAFLKALKVATRRVSVVAFAQTVGLQEQAASAARDYVKTTMPKARKQAMSNADRAEDGEVAHERLNRLNEALAMDPDNAELVEMSKTLREGLLRRIAFRMDCPPAERAVCQQFIDRVADALTKIRRGLIFVVPPQSDRRDAELVVKLKTSKGDTGWKQQLSGQARCKIQRLNDLREVIKDSYTDVSASYKTFSRRTNASVSADVTVRDLRKDGAPMVTFRDSERKNSDKQYYTFNGDERAFNPTTFKYNKRSKRWYSAPNEAAKIAALGTSQTPPTSPQDLLREAWSELADETAKAVLAKLENK